MLELKLSELPLFVQEIDTPPAQLYCQGADLLELLKLPRVAIVGTRNPTIYGQRATEELATQLAEQGVVIVSGLAYGVDAIAHQAALDAGGKCIAVLPSPLDNILPAANRELAQEILDSGGVLVSEYAPGMAPIKQNFIARNRLMSGLSQGVLIIEGAEKSGTLHTARFALDQSRDVMAVPANIYSEASFGCNNLIKSGRAQMVTSYKDVLDVLRLGSGDARQRPQHKGRNRNEQLLLDLMAQGITDGAQLFEASDLTVPKFNQALSMLEISDKIRPLGANHWIIR